MNQTGICQVVKPPPFQLGWQDAGWMAGGLLIQIPAQIRYRAMPSADTAALNRKDLYAIDRWAAGTYSSKAALASDLLIVPFGALPIALTALDAFQNQQGPMPVAIDVAIFAEAIAFSSAFSLLVRSLQIHPRPLVYGKDVPAHKRLSGEASGSFYSGHANGAFLSAIYLAYTYPLRHPEFKGEAWLWAGSLTMATTIAALRVGAGKHFPTDVIVGAATGAFFGWLFPFLHLNPKLAGNANLELRQDSLGIHPMIVWNLK